MPESAAGVTDWLAGEHPYLVLLGDVRETLRAIPDATVRCCVTSPPYFGLRSYLSDGDPRKPAEIGLGALDQYVADLVAVFREVRRVLTPDGTLWLNLGDAFWGTGGANNNSGLSGKVFRPGAAKDDRDGPRHNRVKWRAQSGLKQKDLIGVPWRVALALQADGWWLRSDIVWSKPAPMPESVKDRPTRSHEYIFLLAKSESYYYDADAVAEPLKHPAKANGSFVFGGQKYRHSRQYSGKPYVLPANGKRNRRSVWQINNRASGVKHFATFPPELPRLCLLAGSAPGDVILDPFAGSGTTLAVATELGRRAVGCELNPAYVDLIHDRLATAQTRILAS